MSTVTAAKGWDDNPSTSHRTPPWWMGYLFLLPVRKLWEHPRKVLRPWVDVGDTVFEMGPAMGYFTLDLARLVGPGGRVVCSEVQPKMLTVLERRLTRAGLMGTVDARLGRPDDPCLDDLTGGLDFAYLHHVIHEVTDPARVLGRVAAALRPGGRVFLAEPCGHVSEEEFDQEVSLAEEAGLRVIERPQIWRQMTVVLEK